MKLVYFRLVDAPSYCGQLRRIDLNFCANIKAAYDADSMSLEVSSWNAIDPDFFGSKNIWVSSVIGKNGSGKTSFARLIYQMSISCEGIKALWLTQEKGGYVLSACGLDVNGIKANIDLPHRAQIQTSIREGGFKFVYYSPFFTTQHVMENQGDDFIDISTSNLLKVPSPANEELVSTQYQSPALFEVDENWRVAQFLAEYHKNKAFSDDIGHLDLFCLPEAFTIHANLAQVRTAAAHFGALRSRWVQDDNDPQKKVYAVLRHPNEHRNPQATFCEKVCQLASGIESLPLMSQIACAYVICKFRDEGKGDTQEPTKRDVSLLNVCRLLRKDSIYDELLRQLRESCGVSNPLVQLLEDILLCFDEVHGYVPMSEKGLKAIGKVFYDIKRLQCLRPFITFDVQPKMSPGQWAYLTMLARFWSVIKDPNLGNAVFFLDEAEATLHPEWQRQMVKLLIWFFKNFGNAAASYHVLLATHSPILLSDVPKGNVTFLKPKHPADLEKLKDTFGANIFDLYHLSYFLDQGTVGAFAQDKIDNLVHRIFEHVKTDAGTREHFKQTEADRRLVDLVGDENVRNYLSGWLKNLGNER